MSRRSKIIELALAKSEITDTNAGEEVNRNDNVVMPIERRTPPVFITTGNDLVDFKYNLRQRTPVKIQNEQLSVSKESEEIYSPVVSEYLPPENNAPSVLTPDADTESITEDVVDNYNNLEIQDILQEIVQNQELCNAIEAGRESNEEQPTTQEQREVIAIESQTNEEEPTTSYVFNTNKKKKYPKKVNTGRKRLLNKENWKNAICKRKKNSGEEFINKKGQLIPKKYLKPGCGANCSRKCGEAITEAQRNIIFKQFWELGDHNKQMEYISRFVKRVTKKQAIVGSKSRRQWSLEYYLFIESREIRTCKTMFLNTLSISDMWLQTLFRKIYKSATGAISIDERGRHNTRKNAVPDQVKQSVREHILQMPLVDSHYVRNRSSKQYLDEQLNFPLLYKLYLEWMKENYSDQIVATSRQYKEIFHKDFNIDFNKPKKDQCPRCDLYKNATETDKTKLEYEHALHVANKNVVRTLKDTDKRRAEHSDSVVAVCYDLQKILNTPQSEVSVFYYKRKLACYNFTMYDMGKHKGYCYLWDETIGRKGSNEISSFVFDFIKTKVQEGYKEFNFYSDSCGGQNKNKTVFAMYAYASKIFNINVNHHFFEVGHSQSEGDAMHALIERRKKNKIIYVPQQWVTLIRCAKSTGDPYVVKEVNQDTILDFKQLLPCYNNWEYDVNNAKVSWSKIMHVSYISDLPNKIKFQYDSLSDNEMAIDIAQQRAVSLRSVTRRARRVCHAKEPQNNEKELPSNISKAYNSLLPLTIAKYKDLMSLCKSNAIPAIYHDYYINLSHVNSTQSNNNESDSN